MPIMSDEQLKPRRFIWEKLDVIELLLIDLLGGIDTMVQRSVSKDTEQEQIKYQVASLAEGVVELEIRIRKLEARNSMEQWVYRQVGTILLVSLVAYLVSTFF